MPWRFAQNGKSFEVAVDGALVVNDVPLALRAARDGLGLLQTHSNRVESFVAQGELETVLDDWAPLRQIDFAISLKLFRTRVPAPTPRTPHRRNSHRSNAKRPVTSRPAQHSAECASTA
jgi:DNA-binding transcriptional LysR family regulator